MEPVDEVIDPNGTPVNEETDEMPIDTVTALLANLRFPDALIQELDACNWDAEKYKRYFTNTDLFILRDVLGNVMMNDDDKESVYHVAFCNLIKWMMYMIATNNYWHRRLCYLNRMMGTNINAQSYWRIKWHPAYVPGPMWNDDINKKPEEFNQEEMDVDQFYKWIDNIEEEMFQNELKKELEEEKAAQQPINTDNKNNNDMACKGSGKGKGKKMPKK